MRTGLLLLTDDSLPSWFSQPEEPVQMMERSISLCRLNLRDSDFDHGRNGALGSRVKERSSRFQRGCGQAPPKILISSASQGGGGGPRPVRPATSRSWSSEDFRTDPSPEEGVSSAVLFDAPPEVSLTSDLSQLTDVHSPSGSSVPESVTADSAIGSPDCWLDSDFSAAAEKFSESKSDGSLCDSGTAWELYRAVPVQIATLDEGFLPSTAGGLPEEQPCADEGIYSLSSLESTQEPEPVSQKEFNTSNHSQGIPLDQAPEGGGFQMEAGCQQVATSLLNKDVGEQEHLRQVPDVANLSADEANQPMMTLSAGSPPPSSSSAEEQLSEPAEGLDAAVEQSGDVQDHCQETTTPTENQAKAKDADSGEQEAKGQEGDACSEGTAETFKGEGHLKTPDGTSEGLLRGYEDPHDLVSEELLAPKTSTTIPLITVSSEPEEQDPEEAGEPDRQEPAGLLDLHQSQAVGSSGSDPNPTSSGALEEPGRPISVSAGVCPVETPPCPAAVEVLHRGAGAEPEQEPLGGSDLRILPTAQTTLQTEQGEVRQGCELPQLHSPDSAGTLLALGTQLGAEVTGEARLEDSQPDCATTEQDKGQKTHVFSPGLPAAAGRFPPMDLLHADLDESSPTDDLVGDPLEPMDLFYPDKDEPIFSQPPETALEAGPLVLSVSALQPAPASQLFEDQPPELLAHHVMNTNSKVGDSLLFIISIKRRLFSSLNNIVTVCAEYADLNRQHAKITC